MHFTAQHSLAWLHTVSATLPMIQAVQVSASLDKGIYQGSEEM